MPRPPDPALPDPRPAPASRPTDAGAGLRRVDDCRIVRVFDRLAVPAALLAIALAMFGGWMHWAVLDPRNVGWLFDGNDRGQSALGLAAYLRAGGPWPVLHSPLMLAPDGTSVMFTDSNSLLALMLRPIAAWLPTGWQFVGIWYLVCAAMQTLFAWWLVRPFARDRVAALLGTALLAAMPVLFNRFGHVTLCSQWVILWAIWIFIDRARADCPLMWAAVLAVAALLHSYLLLMVAAIWATAVLAQVRVGPGRGWIVASALVNLAIVIGLFALNGAFGRHFGSTGTYGLFPMAIDAWWNPARPGLGGLLPASRDTGGQAFEGFQYLGAGMLWLCVIAAARLAVSRGGLRRWPPFDRLLLLLPALVVLLLLAVGPAPLWRGEPLWTATLPRGIVDALDPVRAAGRLAWPLTYAIAFAVLVAVLRMRRATAILTVAAVLQLVDVGPMVLAWRAASAHAEDRRLYRRTRDPRWAPMIASATDIQFVPDNVHADLALVEEIAHRAIIACTPMRSTYVSREDRDVRARLDRDQTRFMLGEIAPDRLYVILSGFAPIAAAGRVVWLDQVAVVPPAAPVRTADCPPPVRP